MNLTYDKLRDAWQINQATQEEYKYLIGLGLKGIMNAYGVEAGNKIVAEAQMYQNKHYSAYGLVDISLPEGYFKGTPYPSSSRPTCEPPKDVKVRE